MTSLFVENHAQGLAFYINGDLQFDTLDEVIYHENLVIPALLLAIKRFPHEELRVLICGGGDGLAARELLKFNQVKHIDLVDYNSEVIELGKTVFVPYNKNSLIDQKVIIYVEDAFDFINSVPSNTYHLIIDDFTYPNQLEDTKVYSKEWFKKVNLALEYGGILSVNGMSPQQRATGFWCVYNTLLAANFLVKPLQLQIPSFREHNYGNWGFFLASQIPIEKSEIENLNFPSNLAYLTIEKFLFSLIFPKQIAEIRHQVSINNLRHNQLFYYLLNPLIIDNQSNVETVNFLVINELGNNLKESKNYLSLEATTQAWIEQITASLQGQKTSPDLLTILPLQHYYHDEKVRTEWLSIAQNSLKQIDLDKLLNSIFFKIKDIPPNLAKELKILREKMHNRQPILEISPTMIQFLSALIVTLLMANIVAPDSIFAKGYSSGDSDYDSNYYNPFVVRTLQNIGIGVGMIGIGVALLILLGMTSDNNND